MTASGMFVVLQLLGGGESFMLGNLVANQFLKASNWPYGAAGARLMIIATLLGLLASSSWLAHPDHLFTHRDTRHHLRHFGTELFAKLQSGGNSQYDAIVSSSYYVQRLAHAGLVQSLDKKLIPNMKNLLPQFNDPPYDPGNMYVVPYQWGDTGIAYNVKKLPNAPKSWAILFDPKVNGKYPFAMITNPQVQLGAAGAYLGLHYDRVGKEKCQKAAKLVAKTRQRSNFSGFVDGTPVLRRFARGAVAIGAELSNWNAYASPNKASQPYLDKEIMQPPIMPTKAELATLRFTPVLKGEKLQYVQQLWTAINFK